MAKPSLDDTPKIPENPHLRRRGRFRVDNRILERDWPMLQAVFAGVVPVRAECFYSSRSLVYDAICEEFDEIPEAEETPWYQAEIYEDREGEKRLLNVRWRRLESRFEHMAGETEDGWRYV